MSTSSSGDTELHETRHRIKNHFGVLGSLIRARISLAQSDEARRQIGCVEVIAQIEMALQQAEGRSLYRTLHNMVDLWSRLVADRRVAVLVDDVGSVEVPRTAIVPLALIAHEAVTNSFKHAFPADREGTIRISLQAECDSLLRMHVADNGIGLTEASDEINSGHGCSYVHMMARAINADVQWLNNDGGGTLVCVAAPLLARNET